MSSSPFFQTQHQKPDARCEPNSIKPRTEPIQRSEVLAAVNALADETRLRILELLAAHDALSVHAISTHLDLQRSGVAPHLRQLRKARFISEERDKSSDRGYRLNSARVDEVGDILSQLLSAENAQLVLSDVRSKLPVALRPYLDRNGVIINLPTRKKEQIVLDYLITKFTPGEEYTEKQVNTLIETWHTCQETFYLRRRLVDFELLARTVNGARYWRVKE